MSGSGLLRWRLASLVAAIAVVLGGGTWFAMTKAPAQAGVKDAAARQPLTTHAHTKPAAPPVTVASVSPAAHTLGVNGTSPITVTFSAPLAAGSPMPSVTPSVPGTWQRVSTTAVEFVPAQGFTENTHVLVTVPAGSAGVRSVSGGLLAGPVTSGFWTGGYSMMRADQLLSQLGYLPLTWEPASQAGAVANTPGAQLSAAYSPPPGTFAWQSGYPSVLHNMWAPGQSSEVLTGAVWAFESDHGLTMDGDIGPQVWKALLNAVASGQHNSHGYTYALASQAAPETLTVWHNGQVILTSPANTGIPGRTTADGTFPVYSRFVNTIMSGKNPDGTPYHDSVWYVSYFNGGDAVHYYPRGSYGYPQSLGCVELPYTQAKFIYPYLTYGTLVTVTGPIP